MIKPGSKLLIDEFPLMILPQLATKIGLNEAIVLQQVNYWLMQCAKEKDGRLWIFNTYPDWQKQFPFFSLSTIRRTIKKLEDMGLLITGNYNKLKIDQTKWYTIDFDLLNERYVQNEQACKTPTVQNEHMDSSKWTSQQSNMDRPLPEITSKITTKNNLNNKASSQANDGCVYVDKLTDEAKEVYRHFADKYFAWTREIHPNLNKEAVDKLNYIVEHGCIDDEELDRELYIDKDGLIAIIDGYFNTQYKLDGGGYADHRIWHFLSNGILKNLYYKELY